MLSCGFLEQAWVSCRSLSTSKVATEHYDKLKNWKAENYAYDWDNKAPALHVLFNQVSNLEAAK